MFYQKVTQWYRGYLHLTSYHQNTTARLTLARRAVCLT